MILSAAGSDTILSKASSRGGVRSRIQLQRSTQINRNKRSETASPAGFYIQFFACKTSQDLDEELKTNRAGEREKPAAQHESRRSGRWALDMRPRPLRAVDTFHSTILTQSGARISEHAGCRYRVECFCELHLANTRCPQSASSSTLPWLWHQ